MQILILTKLFAKIFFDIHWASESQMFIVANMLVTGLDRCFANFELMNALGIMCP
jgi:hypothetical protein